MHLEIKEQGHKHKSIDEFTQGDIVRCVKAGYDSSAVGAVVMVTDNGRYPCVSLLGEDQGTLWAEAGGVMERAYLFEFVGRLGESQ